MLYYLRACLANSAGVDLSDPQMDLKSILSLQEQCPLISKYITTAPALSAAVTDTKHPIAVYVHMAVQLINATAG